jgi:hypothetical protein
MYLNTAKLEMFARKPRQGRDTLGQRGSGSRLIGVTDRPSPGPQTMRAAWNLNSLAGFIKRAPPDNGHFRQLRRKPWITDERRA